MIQSFHDKILRCDAKGCTATVAIHSESVIGDIMLLNKARDAKWERIKDKWVCSACYASVKASLNLCGLKVCSNGEVTSQ